MNDSADRDTDGSSTPHVTRRPKISLTYKFAFAIVVDLGVCLVLVFATNPREANAFTAFGTISLAVATIWLGFQTRSAVQVNQDELNQNKNLLELTRKQATSAETSARTLTESNRPFVSLGQNSTIQVFESETEYTVSIPLHNFGWSVALIELGRFCPVAILRRDGCRLSPGLPNTIVMPKDAESIVLFEFDKSANYAGGELIEDQSGSVVALSLYYWFVDGIKTNHFGVHAKFEFTGKCDPGAIDSLRLTDIEFSQPIPFGVGESDPRHVPPWTRNTGPLVQDRPSDRA